jgi:hypothetical protein
MSDALANRGAVAGPVGDEADGSSNGGSSSSSSSNGGDADKDGTQQ